MWPCMTAVHPRAGGEHDNPVALNIGPYGSSPRGRGTRPPSSFEHLQYRFIPARAGNTPARRGQSGPAPVHPRAGGEHIQWNDTSRPGFGSSPRGRGTRTRPAFAASCRRFIPARAGNTPELLPSGSASSVHPRAGGEHACPHGSVRCSRRFIPARAGNTFAICARYGLFTVHPRAGGEHHAGIVYCDPSHGSSPRGRGTLGIAHTSLRAPRFIPARAGNTS